MPSSISMPIKTLVPSWMADDWEACSRSAQVEQEVAGGQADRVLGELLPFDVPNPLLDG